MRQPDAARLIDSRFSPLSSSFSFLSIFFATDY